MYFWLCKLKERLDYFFFQAPLTHNLCAVISCNRKREKRIWEIELKTPILNFRSRDLNHHGFTFCCIWIFAITWTVWRIAYNLACCICITDSSWPSQLFVLDWNIFCMFLNAHQSMANWIWHLKKRRHFPFYVSKHWNKLWDLYY